MAVQTEAILAVSFGTSHNDTRERTIDRIEAKCRKLSGAPDIPCMDQ